VCRPGTPREKVGIGGGPRLGGDRPQDPDEAEVAAVGRVARQITRP